MAVNLLPGTPLAELETPALVIDLDALEHNIGVIAEHYRECAIRLRPHGKNHKSAQILAMQIAAGGTVGGVCAAKVSEAEALAQAFGSPSPGEPARNVLIANQIVDEGKILRLAALARRVDTTVAVDDEAQIPRLAAGALAVGAEIGVVVEIDTMMRRGGARSVAQAVALARLAHATPGVRFMGVMSHQVPTVASPTRRQRYEEGGGYIAKVLEAKRAIEAAGLAVEIVSTGESWTYDVAADTPGVTEIEGGTYIVMEVPYTFMSEFRLAARVMGRVVARPDSRTAIGDVPIDAIGAPRGLPTVDGLAGVAVTALDHHGVTLVGDSLALEVGDTFFLLTHQQDITMNRWDRYIGVRDGKVETVIEANARGCVH